ncbi:unnamed protein product [Cladocopium goreaui]|uniref:Peptidyl-tRNA hydrolase n=1 Tax=Cladocopium goreaui TaxID=2562237 RepID=A0A9P1DXR3_9DINO|nr:unnamed protein product [Cladocopium goreaui]
MPQYEYVTREIGVPVCTLTAADCEELLRGRRAAELPQWVPLNGRRAEFQVPELPDDNVVLQVPLPNGKKLEVPLPERCKEGDTLCLLQRQDDTWKVVPKKHRFSFVVPPCCSGDVLRLKPTDHLELNFAVPENVEAFNVVTLQADADGAWNFQQCAVLPPETEPLPLPEWTSGQYQAILDALKSKGYLDRLCPDESGVLNVGVPFCGHFHEYITLGNFLVKHRLEMPGVQEFSIFGMELFDDYVRDWALAQRWLWRQHQISCCIEAGDLAQDPTPKAQWVIGIHPEVTKGGIIGSLLHSCRGLCCFATFYEEEKDTLLNMIDMYKVECASVDAFENPFYAANELGCHPAMRFIVVVDQSCGENSY